MKSGRTKRFHFWNARQLAKNAERQVARTLLSFIPCQPLVSTRKLVSLLIILPAEVNAIFAKNKSRRRMQASLTDFDSLPDGHASHTGAV
jgi:hypothetical protein